MSLAEVLFALAIFSTFTLVIVMVMVKGMRLNLRDEVLTATTMYCNEVMDQNARTAADPKLFDSLANRGLTFFPYQVDFIYGQSVVNYSADMRKVTVAVYYQDPNVSGVATPDPKRGQAGRIVKMSTLFVRPTEAEPPH